MILLSHIAIIYFKRALIAIVIIALAYVVSSYNSNNKINISKPYQKTESAVSAVKSENYVVTPKFLGTDHNNKQFNIQAAYASQKEQYVKMETINASIYLEESGPTYIVADQGLIDIDKKELLLSGNVVMKCPDGKILITNSVNILYEAGEIKGEGKVVIKSQDIILQAVGFNILNFNGKKQITFKSKVKASFDITKR